MNNRQRGIATAAGLLCIVISGCRSAPTKTYTLFPVAPSAARQDYSGPPLRIDAVHLPPALNHIEMVTTMAPGELALDDMAHWSAPLNQVARQTVSEDLLERLPAGKVIFPHLAKSPGTLGIIVDVLDLQVGRTGARMQASWTIDAGIGDAARKGGAALLQGEPPAPDALGIARALSALLAQLADRIAESL